MTDWDKEFKRARRSPAYWYEGIKLDLSEYFFCLFNRITKDCSKCNYYKYMLCKKGKIRC